MSTRRWGEVGELFERWLEADEDARRTLLADVPPDVRREVERLVSLDADSDGFLDPPELAAVAAEVAPLPAEGTRIGRFRVVRRIAAGGMGTVYEAVQDEPQRTVALKLLSVGRDRPEMLRRFLFEAEILARLQHPGITQVIEAGVHDDGAGGELPYLALEYVHAARDLRTYCREEDVPRAERIRLFLEVCAAVDYGHARGVIHRDLKPENILVDGEGRTRVIDFGVARAADPDGRRARTLTGNVFGTLAYMSPEQLEGSADDLDVRTDVYSLGVVLYELLADRSPLDLEELPLAEVLARIVHADPERLDRDDAELAGELAWITHRAIDKDRERRYASARELAEDLERHLRHEPVRAGPTTALYHLCKFARRHVGLIASSAAVVVAVLGALVVLAWSLVTVRAERDDALIAREEAELVTDFFTRAIERADPVTSGRDVLVKEVLDEAAARVAERSGGRPLLEARMHQSLAQAYFGLSRHAEVYEHALRAYELRERHLGPRHTATLRSEGYLVRHMLGQFRPGALERFEELLPRLVAGLGADDPLTLRLQAEYAGRLTDAGDFERAEELLRTVVARPQGVQGANGDTTLAAQETLADCLAGQSRWAEAEGILRPVVDELTRQYGPEHPLPAMRSSGLVTILLHQGRLAEALETSVRTCSVLEAALGDGHPRTLLAQLGRVYVLVSMGRYPEAEQVLVGAEAPLRESLATDSPDRFELLRLSCVVNKALGRLEEAERAGRELLDLCHRSLGRSAPTTFVATGLLSDVLELRGELGEAERLCREVLDQPGVGWEGTDFHSAQMLGRLGMILSIRGKPDEALPLQERAFERLEALAGERHDVTMVVRNNLGLLYHRLERYEDAYRLLARNFELREEVYDRSSAVMANASMTLGWVLAELDRCDEARALLERAERGFRASLPAEHARFVDLGLVRVTFAARCESDPWLACQYAIETHFAARANAGPGSGMALKALDELERVAFDEASRGELRALCEDVLPELEEADDRARVEEILERLH